MHRIIVSPIVGYGQRGAQYNVTFEGQLIVTKSATPFLDAARVLKARGLIGKLEMWDTERPFPRPRGDIEKAARLTVYDDRGTPRFGRWKPFNTKSISLQDVEPNMPFPRNWLVGGLNATKPLAGRF